MKYASYPQLRDRYQQARFISDRHLGFMGAAGYYRPPNKHNSYGFRGEEFLMSKPANSFRIVCLGASTTYSWGVNDYKKSYPHLLQKYMRNNVSENIEVINAGIAGFTTLETLILFQTKILDLNPDLIIIYHGINDVHARLVWPAEAYRGDYSGFLTAKPFSKHHSILEYSTFLRAFLIQFDIVSPHSSIESILKFPETSLYREYLHQKSENTYPEGVFGQVSAKDILHTNKPVYFKRNIKHLLSIANEHQIKSVIMSFAYTTKYPNKYTHYTEYQDALSEMNEVLKKLSKSTQSQFFNFAKLMPTDKKFFKDGVHFTAEGNKLRAKLIGDFLIKTYFPDRK